VQEKLGAKKMGISMRTCTGVAPKVKLKIWHGMDMNKRMLLSTEMILLHIGRFMKSGWCCLTIVAMSFPGLQGFFPVPQQGHFHVILVTHDELTFYANN
jgi:hypothetical protein